MSVNSKEIVLYHAEWCGHCKKFTPLWDNFVAQINEHKDDIKNKYNVVITAKDYEETDPENKELIAEKNIAGFPTIHINDREYKGERDISAIVKEIIPNISPEDMDSWFAVSDSDSDLVSEKSEKLKPEDKMERGLENFMKQIKIGGSISSSNPSHRESLAFYKYLKYKEKYHKLNKN